MKILSGSGGCRFWSAGLSVLLLVSPLMAQQRSGTAAVPAATPLVGPATAPATMPTARATVPPAVRNAEPVGDPSVASPRSGDSARSFMQTHQRLVQRARQGNIDLLFLGDSITQFWDRYPDAWKKLTEEYRAANFGVAGDRVENLLWRIENGELQGLSPKVIVLMIGTNNTGINSADQIAAGIQQVVQTLKSKSPNSKIILLSLLPRNREGEEAKSDAIRQINANISRADDGSTVRYLDLASKFASPDGKITRDLMVDGLHPTGKGYELWGDTMEALLKELMM
jgi:lysophospholipase L1-like esterase